MKLLHCTKCHDIQAMHLTYRSCYCGSSSGKYLEDGLRVAISGDFAMVMCVLNQDLPKAIAEACTDDIGPASNNYAWWMLGPKHQKIVKT